MHHRLAPSSTPRAIVFHMPETTLRVVRGDIADLVVDAICTSTNPRLSLFEGTGGAVAEKGGWEIKRECEALLEQEQERTGSAALRVGSVRVTSAGSLRARIVIHCVASDSAHRSSREIIMACVANALATARKEGCRSIAMPVFATGHAAFRFDDAVDAMGEAIRERTDGLREIVVAVMDDGKVDSVRRTLSAIAGVEVG